jgi:alanine racemase
MFLPPGQGRRVDDHRRKDEMNRTLFHEPWIEISLDNLVHNLAQVRRRLAPATGIIAVVKDSAYGCGAGPVATILERNGVTMFAVGRTTEAHYLRSEGISSPILVLGRASADDLAWGALNNIHFALDDVATIAEWRNAGVPVTFHLEIDTGMTRMGIDAAEIDQLLPALGAASGFDCVGVFTHLACADAASAESVDRQLARFEAAVVRLKKAGIEPRMIHAANSAASIRYADRFTLARPGIVLYGCNPDPAQNFGLDLRPVAMLKAPVARVRKVPAATPVSYGWTAATKAETFIATVAAGYGQGVPRFLSNQGSVLIGGRPYPIIGRVTMDYVMVDVGPTTTVMPGDEAVLLGTQGGGQITADEIALKGGTIGYEILCNLGTGIHRYYFLDGQPFRHQPPCLL